MLLRYVDRDMIPIRNGHTFFVTLFLHNCFHFNIEVLADGCEVPPEAIFTSAWSHDAMTSRHLTMCLDNRQLFGKLIHSANDRNHHRITDNYYIAIHILYMYLQQIAHISRCILYNVCFFIFAQAICKQEHGRHK
jgi:hypothetical protein